MKRTVEQVVTIYIEGGKEVARKNQRIITEYLNHRRSNEFQDCRPNEPESVCPACGKRKSEKEQSGHLDPSYVPKWRRSDHFP